MATKRPLVIATGQQQQLQSADTLIGCSTFTAASQAAMLALTAFCGDICVRSDNSTTYRLSTNSPTTLADWVAFSSGGAGAASQIVVVKTANYTLLAGDSGNIFSNVGAAGTVILTLPTAIALPGSGIPYRYRGRISAAQILRFQTVGSDLVYSGSQVSSAGGYIQSNVRGGQIELMNDESGIWVVSNLTPIIWALN